MHICYPLPDPICYPLAVYILRAQMRFEKGFLFKFELFYLTGLFSLGIFVRRSLSMGGCSLSRERGLCFSIILFLNHGLACSLGVFNLPLSNHCCLHPHWFWRTYQHSYWNTKHLCVRTHLRLNTCSVDNTKDTRSGGDDQGEESARSSWGTANLGESTKPGNKTWSTGVESSIFSHIIKGHTKNSLNMRQV